MLKHLYAKNYALLKEISIEFDRGLNIITGETGAGKSIIVGALGAILGDKVDPAVIARGSEKVVLEGEFEIDSNLKLYDVLVQNELPHFEECVILRREVAPSGRSRAFINDQPTTTAVLEKVGEMLVDLHGQHEHQSLLRVETHCSYLDAFGLLQPQVLDVTKSFLKLQETQKKLSDLRQQEKNLQDMTDLYQFQLREIQAIDPESGEDEELEREERILRNAEILYEKTVSLYADLYDSEGAVLDRIAHTITVLGELCSIDEKFKPLKAESEAAQISLDEVASSLQRYVEEISFDPARLEDIRVRLGQLNGLKKKYGGSLKAVLNYKSVCERYLAQANNFESDIEDLSRQVAEIRKSLAEQCHDLSTKRKACAIELEEKIAAQLSKLGMPKAQIHISIQQKLADNEIWIEHQGERIQATQTGIDFIEFEISANPGENPKPLAKIASGGEISRVMLALKSVLSEVDNVPVLVFDEIDIGISGRIAQSVGGALRALSSRPQVICITHLPQIASMADHHFFVEKTITEYSTSTTIRKLDEKESIEQVAKLLGGERITEAHIKGAEDLIAEGRSLKVA